MAQIEPEIVVNLGKNKYSVPHSTGLTFGQLRECVATESGLDAASFRFLCKGRAVKDTELVSSGAPPALLKVMALRTKSFHKQQQIIGDRKPAASSGAGLTSTLEQAREQEQRNQQTSKHVSVAAVRPSAPLGDVVPDGAPFVVVRVGRKRYHVLTEDTLCVRDVKDRLAGMDGIDVRAADINLIFSGRQCRDADTLAGVGVKRGSMMMMLARASHHDAVDARTDLRGIRAAADILATRASQISVQNDRRLSDAAEIRARLADAEGEAAVLRDQLRANRSEDNAKGEVADCLSRAEEVLASVRERMS